MASYKITGRRFVRKYSAANKTPTYAASADAIKVAESLCEVPWTETAANVVATFPAHSGNATTDGENVENRDWFDAALFCGEHANGMHRAFANAACYRFTLPDAAVGVSLTELKAPIFSDPYNAHGARVALYTSSSPDLPMACAVCRKGSSADDSAAAQANNGTESTPATEWYSTNTHVEGVAPRRSDGTSWFANAGAAFIRPTGGLALQKYLFVFILLERYDVARNGYLEGSSYSEPTFGLTTAEAISGWTDGETVDCGQEGTELVIRSNNVQEPVGLEVFTANVHVLVNWNANSESPYTSGSLGAGQMAVSEVYARFHNGEAVKKDGGGWKIGVGFVAERGFGAGAFFYANRNIAHLVLSHALVPFSVSDGFAVKKIRFNWAGDPGGEFGKYLRVVGDVVYNVWIADGVVTAHDGPEFSNSGLYDVNEKTVGRWRLVDSFWAPDRVQSKSDPWPAEEFVHESPLSGIEVSRKRPYTLLLTAYVGRDAVERLIDYSAESVLCEAGMIEGELYDLYGGLLEVCVNCWSPKITLVG